MKIRMQYIFSALMLCISVFLTPSTAYAQDVAATITALPGTVSATSDPEERQDSKEKPLSPDGQAAITDNATNKDGKEFYTFTTPDDNVFYLVIDKQRDSVYFLNAVTEQDLMALAEKSPDKNAGSDKEGAVPVFGVEICTCKEKCGSGEVDLTCLVCRNELTDCVGKAVNNVQKETEMNLDTDKGESAGTIIFILFASAAVAGAGYYLKIYKPKHDLDNEEDLDDLLADDETEEPEINEDGAEKVSVVSNETENESETILYDDYPDDCLDSGPEVPDEPEAR